MSSITILKF